MVYLTEFGYHFATEILDNRFYQMSRSTSKGSMGSLAHCKATVVYACPTYTSYWICKNHTEQGTINISIKSRKHQTTTTEVQIQQIEPYKFHVIDIDAGMLPTSFYYVTRITSFLQPFPITDGKL